MDRPTFYFKGNPVRAAGVLLWTHAHGRTLRLFNKYNGKYEDMGGKTDARDACPMDTAVREACEETNCHIFSPRHDFHQCADMLHNHIVDSPDVRYNHRSKYLLYRVRVHPSMLSMDMRRFGRAETTEWGVLEHYFQWRRQLPYPNQLHPRLQGLEL